MGAIQHPSESEFKDALRYFVRDQKARQRQADEEATYRPPMYAGMGSDSTISAGEAFTTSRRICQLGEQIPRWRHRRFRSACSPIR